ncbi:MAG: OsmC family protein [Chromatiales bacterium]|nr:OsmC family protein [Chromatiales bacterium]
MAEEQSFTIHMEHQEGFAFNVRFDWPSAADVLMDEPSPLGEQKGPNASRMLAAATANCLSASLLYCITKGDAEPSSLRSEVTCSLVRNEKKRLRVGSMKVRLIVDDKLKESARTDRCLALFEDFCVVSDSIRKGIPIEVEVADQAGTVLHRGT